LKTQLHRKIYINRWFLRSGCSCRKDGLYAYELALDKTGVWPLEQVLNGRDQISIQKVLNGLSTFQYEAPNSTCSLCSQEFEDIVVSQTVENVQDHFEGLCLDCIDSQGDETGTSSTINIPDREYGTLVVVSTMMSPHGTTPGCHASMLLMHLRESANSELRNPERENNLNQKARR